MLKKYKPTAESSKIGSNGNGRMQSHTLRRKFKTKPRTPRITVKRDDANRFTGKKGAKTPPKNSSAYANKTDGANAPDALSGKDEETKAKEQLETLFR